LTKESSWKLSASLAQLAIRKKEEKKLIFVYKEKEKSENLPHN
jgi:hypothetical protein